MSEKAITLKNQHANLEKRMSPTQKWKLIPDTGGFTISSDGQVRNKKGKLLKQHLAARDAGFYVNIGKTTRLVHVLMLLVFFGPGTKPCHINGNKLDNRLSNLCYGEPGHKSVAQRCRKNHELVGDNVEFWGKNRICVACREGRPAVRELPEVL